jgi:AraC-like DNA-binding protein
MATQAEREIPHFQVSSDDVPPAMAFDAFQQSVQDVFTLSRVDSEGERAYRLDLIAWHLGTLMLGSFRSSALAFDRPPSLVASGGLDHALVQLYVEGGFTGLADDRPVTVEPGDIVIFDLSRTLHTRASDFGNISLLIPRAFFETGGTDIAPLHGLVLRADAPFTGVLSSYLVALVERMPTLGPAEADVAAKATAALVTTILSAQEERGAPTGRAIASPFRKVSLEIDRRLRDPALDPDTLASALGMSRATLYRTFEAVGGVADHIRRRRLSIAAVAMAAPENQRRTLADIAFDSGFASESAFNRAFKLAFGLPPSQARKRSAQLWSPSGGTRNIELGADFARWMRTLRA